MPGNKRCGTCFYYEPSPLWRKGWCRNPSLFESRVNHLVEAGEYSCQATFRTDFWVAATKRKSKGSTDSFMAQPTEPMPSPAAVAVNLPEGHMAEQGIETGSASGATTSAGKKSDQIQWGLRPASRRTGLSIIVPVAAIVIVMISLLGWISYSTAGAKEGKAISTTASPSPTLDLINPMFGSSPAATATAAPAVALAVDGYARVIGTEDNGLQVRLEPGSESPSVALLPDGTIVHLLRGPLAVDGYLWWEIEADGKSGWSADKWLAAVSGPAG